MVVKSTGLPQRLKNMMELEKIIVSKNSIRIMNGVKREINYATNIRNVEWITSLQERHRI